MSASGQILERTYDAVIIGAGFYGCALAEHLSGAGKRVLVCERGEHPMERASAVNQARVHTGFHYPRSYATALRSWRNFERFVRDYEPAIVRDFQMLYAIARHGTKVDPQRFYGLFKAMGTPIAPATPSQKSMFSTELIDEVFACTEYAFDYTVLRTQLLTRLSRLNVTLACKQDVLRIEEGTAGSLRVCLEGGKVIEAENVFNVTYALTNRILQASGLKNLPLKHELVEIALVDPPAEMSGTAVTVMDGAYFSCMPYPAASAYSLTHVRYTPHRSWIDDAHSEKQPEHRELNGSRWRHMINDSRRYMPIIDKAKWRKSIFDVKSVPIKNEQDDGRPILLQPHPELPGFTTILGSKIDNIYDLFEAIPQSA